MKMVNVCHSEEPSDEETPFQDEFETMVFL